MEEGRLGGEDRIVVVGAGHAGLALAAALRQHGHRGPLKLIGDEAGLPYARPPLSKAYLTATVNDESLHLRPAAFFAPSGITLLAPERAVAVDRAARTVRLASGGVVPYDRLVLATGSRNRRIAVPGADLPGVHSLRTMAEARKIRSSLAHARSVVVVGAGFIGLEIAATARLAGRAVTVVDIASRPMSRVLSPAAAAWLQRHHEALGTAFLFEAAVTAVEPLGGRAGAVVLADGRGLPADLVVVGVGAVANVDLATAAELAVAGGVVVDGAFRTTDPAIFAIGDCAEGPSAFGGGAAMRVESVQNANDSARALAAFLLGAAPAPLPVPWFWSDQGDAKLQIAGIGGSMDAEAVSGDGSGLTVMRFRGDRLACVETINRPGDHMAARKLIGDGGGPSLAEARSRLPNLRSLVRAVA